MVVFVFMACRTSSGSDVTREMSPQSWASLNDMTELNTGRSSTSNEESTSTSSAEQASTKSPYKIFMCDESSTDATSQPHHLSL